MNNYYDDYLKSDYWRDFKAKHRNTEKYRQGCRVCGCPEVDYHHLNYDHLYHEDFDRDIALLCRKHHKQFHKYIKLNNLKYSDISVWLQDRYPKSLNNPFKKLVHTKSKKQKKLERKRAMIEYVKNLFNKIKAGNKDYQLNNQDRTWINLNKKMLDFLGIEAPNVRDQIQITRKHPLNKEKLLYLLYCITENKLIALNNESFVTWRDFELNKLNISKDNQEIQKQLYPPVERKPNYKPEVSQQRKSNRAARRQQAESFYKTKLYLREKMLKHSGRIHY